jgi:hypothetical protein
MKLIKDIFLSFKAMLGIEGGNGNEEHKKDESAGRQRRGKEHVPAHTIN